MRAAFVFTVTLLTTHAASTCAADIVHQRVFGPELPGKYKHPATFDQLDNGDLYLVYYGGTGEYGDDTAVYGARLVKGTQEWTRPVIVADTPNRSEGNAVIWQAPGGVVWLFYLTRYGETWSTSRIKFKISKDEAHTWSDPAVLAFEQGMMVRSRPIVLNDGDYLLPIYHETGYDREKVGHDTSSLFLRRNHQTGEWTETNRVYSRIGNLQPAPVQITNDYLVAYCRRGGGYGPMKAGFIVRTESRDGGTTWSPGKDTEFVNPNSAVDMIRLKNGHLVLAYNDNNQGKRMPLTVAVSTDDENSWPHRRDIVNKLGNTAAYPNLMQTDDGKIHLIYTSAGRTVVNHMTFDENAVLGRTK